MWSHDGRASTSATVPAVSTVCPSRSRMSRRLARVSASSSTTSKHNGGEADINGLPSFRRRAAAERGQQARHVEGFIADGVGPLGDGLAHQKVHLLAPAGDDHRPRMRVGLAHQAQHRAAVPPGQLHVDQHHAEILTGHRASASASSCASTDAIAVLAKQVPQGVAQVVVVIDDHDQRLVKGGFQQTQQEREIDRLGQDLPRPGGEGLLLDAAAGEGGHDQGDGGGLHLADLAVQRDAVHPGHLQVQQGDVIGALLDLLQRRGPVVSHIDGKPQVREDVRQIAAGIDVVIHHQDRSPFRVHDESLPSAGAAAG